MFGAFIADSACAFLILTDSGAGSVIVGVFLALSHLDLAPSFTSGEEPAWLPLFLAALFTVLTVLATHSSKYSLVPRPP